MRIWSRATEQKLCDAAPECAIYIGQPFQTLNMSDAPMPFKSNAKFIYCMQHAQGQSPPDLPMDIQTNQQRTKRMEGLGRIAVRFNNKMPVSGRDRQVKE